MAKKVAVLVVNPVNGSGLFQYLETFFENGRVGAQELCFYGIFLEHQIVSFQFDVCVRIGLGEVSLDFIYMFYQGFR